MHVVCVGVSRYRHLSGGDRRTDYETFGLAQLSSAAIAAYNVASWFRKSYHNPAIPLGSIRLLLSPSSQEEQIVLQTARHVPNADKAAVATALFDWRRDLSRHPGSMGFCYLAGHGMLVDRESPVVLLNDFAATPRVFDNAVNVGALRLAMTSAAAGVQIFVADACQIPGNPTVDRGSGYLLDDAGAVEHREVARIIYASSPRGLAYGVTGQGSLLSRALIDCLDGRGSQKRGDGWWVTTHLLESRVTQDLRMMAAQSDVCQRPILAGHSGDVLIHRLPTPPQVLVRVGVLPDEWRSQITGNLFDCNGRGLRENLVFPYQGSHEAGLYKMHFSASSEMDLRVSERLLAAIVPDGVDEMVDLMW